MSSAVRVQVDVPDRPLGGCTPAQLVAMNRAYKDRNRQTGFASTLQSAQPSLAKKSPPKAKPKPPQKKPPKQKSDVALDKQLLGCVYGVLLKKGGEIVVTLPPKESWAAEHPATRNKALAVKIVDVVLGDINNREDRICKEAELKTKVQDVIEKTLAAGNTQLIRSRSMSISGTQYRVWVKPSNQRGHTGDGRPAKRFERMKTAIELRKRAA
jgi:hypothetical protein